MKRFLLFLIVGAVLFPLSGNAQTRKADRHYLLYEYALAIPLYEKIVEKERRGYEEAIPKLADCYRQINEFEKAEEWYAKAVKLSDVAPLTYYYYGQVLRVNEKYDLAAVQFRKFANLDPDDLRGNLYAGYCDSVYRLNDSDLSFEVKNMDTLNSSYEEFSPVYYKEGIVFTSNKITDPSRRLDKWAGAAYFHFFYSDYMPAQSAEFPSFEPPVTIFSTLDNGYHAATCSFDTSFSKMYFTQTDRERVKRDEEHIRTHILKIFSSENEEGKWVSEKPFYLNNDKFSVSHPSLNSDGTCLYFASDMPGGFGETDIYVCVREADSSWSAPINLGPSVNTVGKEQFPTIHQDSILYFASEGHLGYGGFDIVEARRISDAKWAYIRTLPAPLNSSYDDFGLVFDESNERGLFCSNRKGGHGGDDIYAFTMAFLEPEEDLPPPLSLTLTVKEKATLEPLSEATFFLLNGNTDEVTILESNPFGIANTPVDPSTPYQVKAMKEGYLVDCMSFYVGEEVPPVRDLLLPAFVLNEVFEVKNIYYDFDKAYIRPDAESELMNLVNVLRENPIKVELGSHTDCRGNDAYNEALSQRRADSAVAWIVKRGIAPDRITARGYGEYQLTNRCSNGVPCSKEEHQANRRTEIKITSVVKQKGINYDSLKGFKPGEVYPLNYFPTTFFDNCK